MDAGRASAIDIFDEYMSEPLRPYNRGRLAQDIGNAVNGLWSFRGYTDVGAQSRRFLGISKCLQGLQSAFVGI